MHAALNKHLCACRLTKPLWEYHTLAVAQGVRVCMCVYVCVYVCAFRGVSPAYADACWRMLTYWRMLQTAVPAALTKPQCLQHVLNRCACSTN
jgi:hypothetical protein